MFKWIIEYWNNETKSVECFSSDGCTWEDAPLDNVIYVYLQRRGIRPYGNPDKIYTMKKSGVDNYFFFERRNGILVLGGWNDDGRPNTMIVWHPNGYIESHTITERPSEVLDEQVKRGVWVEEPYARWLGLSWSPNSADAPPFKRKIKDCLSNG